MGAQAPHPSRPQQGQLLEEFVPLLLGADQIGASKLVGRAIELGWTIDDVRFDLITPALAEVGARWERGAIGVADEHLASSVCEWLLFNLAGRASREAATGRRAATGPRAIVGCSDGELHSLGARIVAHVLAEHGWTVLYLGAATPPAAWAQIVRSRRADVVVLCTTMPSLLARVRAALKEIKSARPDCRTVVGGQAYWGRPDAHDLLRPDLLALDARKLTEQVERLHRTTPARARPSDVPQT